MSPVVLRVAGAEFKGWTDIRITRSLEQMSGEFELGVTQTLGTLDDFANGLREGQRCQVLAFGQVVIDGYLERVDASISATDHTVSVSGRDVTCDLIDSAAQLDKQELANVTIKQAALALLKPFNISVSCPKEGKPFKKFAVNHGETVFSVLNAHAKQRGMLLYTLGDGVLHIGQPVHEDIDYSLKEGRNILSASASHDTSQQFHTYIIKGQGKGKGKTKVSAKAIDSTQRPARVTMINAERNDESSLNDLGERAAWEARRRKAKGRRAQVKLRDWRWKVEQVRQLWNVGQRVYLDAPRLRYQEHMLITSVTYSITESEGLVSELTLSDPVAYESI